LSALDWTIPSLSDELRSGRSSSAALIGDVLARAASATAAGVFVARRDAYALHEAARHDMNRRVGLSTPPLAGLPVSVKDCFDWAGEVTQAGSLVLSDCTPASRDAEVVRRLKAAGAVVVGRTNMSEFAYTPFGLNPHFGNPANPYDAARIPGGSSSGAAVSVALRLAVAAIGSDTGGSVRLPAALCGVAGFKPTQARACRQGMLPLSPTLDCVGWIANSADDCTRLDAILSGPSAIPECRLPRRLAMPRGTLRDLDATVTAAFEAATARLADAGVELAEIELPELDEIVATMRGGGFSAYEAARWHGERLDRFAGLYDPPVRNRILLGRSIDDAHYRRLGFLRRELMASVDARLGDYDGLVMPTVPIVAPLLVEVADPGEVGRIGALLLRNTAPWNFLDQGALTLPIAASDNTPVGLMLVGKRNDDGALLSHGRAVEALMGLRNLR
jgi:aspartyl-tRNA(Asn)/glutamyl-tRNA(Gln) amidotransferase subunit A